MVMTEQYCRIPYTPDFPQTSQFGAIVRLPKDALCGNRPTWRVTLGTRLVATCKILVNQWRGIGSLECARIDAGGTPLLDTITHRMTVQLP